MNCAYCGVEFNHNPAGGLYCSEKCRKEATTGCLGCGGCCGGTGAGCADDVISSGPIGIIIISIVIIIGVLSTCSGL
jgi:hypothetical protein